MSKELIARLRDINHREELADEAADRIEALEQATDLAIQINNGHVAEIERLEAERDELLAESKWIALSERMPNPEEYARVLIYTEGHDFNGEQFFDVTAESLNECFYSDEEDQPAVCRFATHWSPLPFPALTKVRKP